MVKLQKKNPFPLPEYVELENGIKQEIYTRNDTIVKVSCIPPGVEMPLHSHKEAQIGIVIKGSMLMNVDGEKKVMAPEKTVYIAPPHTMHGAVNVNRKETIALDILRYKENEVYTVNGDSCFLDSQVNRELLPGMAVQFFFNDWFELMIASIPKLGGAMPSHKHKNEQIGICIAGDYTMNVEGFSKEMAFGTVYFCEEKEEHSAVNNNERDSKSINLFFPPRYNKPRKADTNE
ncbi:bacilysin biosynthesis protein BacB [Evansella caseinilytica]|uniref:Bacilysin biosynthesis protein BacB n=1 Tax=Evansella caseinilytica TaxID=1503961 RepID=A0A1H3G3N8_9BACI|nr:cupin domain-containing protein [Evansella caseinilytica]SDX97866.1 bacilysin biosynthesis protein BacB [Evansella caseinilytica]